MKVLSLTFSVGLLAFIAGVVVVDKAPTEPAYESKTVRDWLKILSASRTAEQTDAAENALRHIGTNALPWVTSDLRAHDIPWKRQAIAFSVEHGLLGLDQFPPASARHFRGIRACLALGALAQGAVPALSSLLSDTTCSGEAASALAAIRSDKPVTVLVRDLTDTNAQLRGEAAIRLGTLHDDAVSAVPALVARLQDNQPLVRAFAAYSLGRIHKRPALVLPALIEAAADTNALVRRFAVTAIGRFRSQAQNADRVLMQSLRDPDESVRDAAREALKKIDPEAAAKAAVK